MKNNLYFENVIDVGNLYLEYIFLEFSGEPIFFTCVDEQKQIYICLCSEIRGEQRWIITECSINILQAAIDGRVDMPSLFRLNANVVLVKRTLEEKEESFLIPTQDIDPLDLPKKGTFLRCNQMEAINYLTNKKFAVLSEAINNMLRTLYIQKEKKTYSTVIETNISLELNEKNISSRIVQEALTANDNEYGIEKRITYQDSDKIDVESINNEYFFAA